MKILKVHISPNAKREEILGSFNGDYIKISIMAPAVDGKANKALINFIAKKFHIPKSSITIIKGLYSRDKTLSIDAEF